MHITQINRYSCLAGRDLYLLLFVNLFIYPQENKRVKRPID